MFEKITNSISAFAIALIYLGYCNLDFYYRNFNIDITKYATSAEILLSFIPVINIILLAYILSFLFYKIYSGLILYPFYYLNKKYPSFHKKSQNAYLTFKDKDVWNNSTLREKISACGYTILTKNGITVTVSIGILWQGLIIIQKPNLNYKIDLNLSIYIITGFSLIIIAVFEIIKLFNFKKLEFKIMGVKAYSAILLIVSLICLLFVLNNEESKYIKNGRILKTVEFDFNQNHVQTDSTLIYIGEVQEYLFLYDLKDEETSVYSKNAITKIKIGDKTDINLSENLFNLFVNKQIHLRKAQSIPSE